MKTQWERHRKQDFELTFHEFESELHQWGDNPSYDHLTEAAVLLNRMLTLVELELDSRDLAAREAEIQHAITVGDK